jgi:hypothetical protein
MAQTHIPPRGGGPRAPTGGGRPPQPPPPTGSFSEVAFGSKIDPKLYSDIAERAARNVAQDRNKNKPAQLRRFYDELVLLHDKIVR